MPELNSRLFFKIVKEGEKLPSGYEEVDLTKNDGRLQKAVEKILSVSCMQIKEVNVYDPDKFYIKTRPDTIVNKRLDPQHNTRNAYTYRTT